MTEAQLDRLSAHPSIARFIRALAAHPPVEMQGAGHVRLAAILLALRSREDGEPELLLIKRADAEGDPWSGHVAFPGGRMEPADSDLAVTAVRETWEETGIDVARDGRLLGQLDDLSPRSALLPPIIIRPFVAIVRSDVGIIASAEVASAFWVPVSVLAESTSWGTGLVHTTAGQRRVSTFRHGEHTVWGLTERVLRQFLTYLGEPPVGESVDHPAR